MLKLIHFLWLKASQWIQLQPIKSEPDAKPSMPSTPPRWGDDKLSEHMGYAIHNSFVTFAQNKSHYDLLTSIDRVFVVIENKLQDPEEPWPLLLLFRAHAGYRAACQLIISGHVTESIPILRTCLEYALYALHISKNATALEAWKKHSSNNIPLKSISRKFSMSALKSTLKNTNPELLAVVDKLYQSTINFGAHPNPLAINSNIEFVQDKEQLMVATHILHGKPEMLKIGVQFAVSVGSICQIIFVSTSSKCSKNHEVKICMDQLRRNLPIQVERP